MSCRKESVDLVFSQGSFRLVLIGARNFFSEPASTLGLFVWESGSSRLLLISYLADTVYKHGNGQRQMSSATLANTLSFSFEIT